jgi:hypothetical protein
VFEVLHVPKASLRVLFSACAALAKGMAAHFSTPAQSGSPDRVEVGHGSHVVFTASTHGELCFLDFCRSGQRGLSRRGACPTVAPPA